MINATHQRGMTILELMVAMLLGVMLLGGVVAAFSGQITTRRQTAAVSEAQESARMALSMLAEDISRAGFRGDLSTTPLENTAQTQVYDFQAPWAGMQAGNAECISSANGGTFPVANSPMKFRMLYAENSVGAPMLGCGVTPDVGTPIIQVKRMIPDANLVLGVNEQDDRYYGLVGLGTMLFYPGNNPPAIGAVPNGIPYQYQHHIYSIETVDDVPSLFRRELRFDAAAGGFLRENTTGPLVDGIERVTLQFGIDTDGDEVVNMFVDTAQMNITHWEGMVGDIIAVRISVLSRSITNDTTATGAAFDRSFDMGEAVPFVANADGFRRTLLSTTVSLGSTL